MRRDFLRCNLSQLKSWKQLILLFVCKLIHIIFLFDWEQLNGIKLLFVVIVIKNGSTEYTITTAARNNTLQHCNDLADLLEQESYMHWFCT